ncbi:histidine phosphatase family protein, partial [Arthrobacter sp. JCM 19049]|uniref:histidine phosphatase family protein n=1 Tax=Arthrobacter sp. JCM 19049 TaxID=1460643 RepID=UPI0027954984
MGCVLASPLGRAQESAQIIAKTLGARTGPPVPELVERGFGPLEGQCRSELDEDLVQELMEQAEPRSAV